VLLDRQRVHWPQRLELRAKLLGLGAQRLVVDLDRRERDEQLVERLPPLGLEPLTDRRAPPRQLGEAQLGVMQLVGDLVLPPAGLVLKLIGVF
jgi:hypothetical protein